MKRLVYSLLIVAVAIIACSKEKTNATSEEQSLSVSALPLKVTSYVSNNYPAETITSALKLSSSSATYIVTLNTLEELAFDENGDFLGNGEQFHHHHGDSLGGFPEDSIHHDGDTTHGHHGGHGGHCGNGGHGNTVSLDSLPSAIAEYISGNYSGYTAKHAGIDSLCQFGVTYEVMIEQTGSNHLKLFFDMSGNFIMKAERARYADAPQPVKDYIVLNYADNSPRTKMEIYTLGDMSIEYGIFLAKEGSRKCVMLKEDGTFICEK
jgi:hypothetical protein